MRSSPIGTANLAWAQHSIHYLAPTGVPGSVLAHGSMSSSQSGEGQICQPINDANLADSMVALPRQLFHPTQIHPINHEALLYEDSSYPG